MFIIVDLNHKLIIFSGVVVNKYFKNIKNVKDVGMACQKDNDIKVKVNLQSLIPVSFSH